MPCLSCNTFGHKSIDCHRTTPNESYATHAGVNSVQVLRSPVNMCKDIFINNNLFYGLVDTGSQLTLLKHSAWIKLGAPSLTTNTTALIDFGFFLTKIMGSFSAHITIDNLIFPVTISVIPDNRTHYDLTLCCDVINMQRVTCKFDYYTRWHCVFKNFATCRSY